MPGFTFESNIEFEVYCDCGEGLCNNTEETQTNKGNMITIKPCKKCLSEHYNKGYDEGHDKGYDEGHDNN